MKLLRFPVIKLTLLLCPGIVLGDQLNLQVHQVLGLSLLLFVLFGGALLVTRNLTNPLRILDIFIGVLTIVVGCLIVELHDARNYPNHYLNHAGIQNDSLQELTIRVKEVLRPSLYHDKYVVEAQRINGTNVNGKILLNLSRDSLSSKLQVDEIYLVKSRLTELNKPLNPHQFDYSRYLERQGIYRQLNLTKMELLRIDSTVHTLRGHAARFRTTLNNRLQDYNFRDEGLAIINALLLGQRQEISRTVYDDYAQAGAIHILAISGLHIGLILLILNRILKPIAYWQHGVVIKSLIIIVLLWSFAIIAGLSASVTRAVTMFTFVAIALNLKRMTNIYNTLASSMFVLLLFNPQFLFDVGFQLSYSAVLAIVIIQPYLGNLWKPKLKVTDYLWQIFTVSLAAQVGVLPLSLYYFHQFPGLFFVSNLVILPFLGIILGFGLLVLFLAYFNWLSDLVAVAYGSLIHAMTSFVSWVADQEAFVFKDIAFNAFHLAFAYLFIICLIFVMVRRNYKSMMACGLWILMAQLFLIYERNREHGREFIIFHKSRHSLLGFRNYKHLTIHHSEKIDSVNKDPVITNYKVGTGIRQIDTDTLRHVYLIDSLKLLVIDSSSVYAVRSFKPDLILLRHSPRVNLERLIDSLNPKMIISDGSNYRSYQDRWERSCEAKKIPFHRTGEKGAYIIRY